MIANSLKKDEADKFERGGDVLRDGLRPIQDDTVILKRDIYPDDNVMLSGKRMCYKKGATVKINLLGPYVKEGLGGLEGWLFKNTKTRELYKLVSGIDY